jgi:RNA polymerase sigma-70 factor (ECF subfamily)
LEYFGQVQDWQTIIDKHGPMVWKTAYRLLADYHDAQDCFQETFVSALQLWEKEPVRNLPGLLLKIASSRAIDRLRDRYRRGNSSGLEFEAITSTDAGPDEQAHAAETAEQLRRALAQVPPQEAEIFCLRCLNDLSYRQIAKLMGIERSNVGVTLYRTKQRLREILEREEKTSESQVRYKDES